MGIAHFKFSKRVKRVLLVIALLLVLCFLLATILVWTNKEKIESIVVNELNKHLQTEVNVKEIDLAVLSSFPMVSLEFSDVVIKDVLDTLGKERFVAVENLAVKFNLWDILCGRYNVKKILVENGQINLKIDKDGNCNYIFWKQTQTDSKAEFSFALNSVEFRNVNVCFRNDISRLFLQTKIAGVEASGNFSDDFQKLDLEADLSIETLVFDKLKLTYSQRLNLDIEAENNTQKQLITLTKADLALSKMQFDLNGSYFYGDKNQIDVALIGNNIDLKQLLSLLENENQNLFKDFKTEGLVNVRMIAKGDVSKEVLPEINAEFDVSNASLKNKKLNVICENINLRGKYSNGLERNSKSSVLSLDKFSFNLNKGFFEGRLMLKDFSNFDIDANVKTNLNVENIKPFLQQDSLIVFKGVLKADVQVKGKGLKNLKAQGNAELERFAFKDLRLSAVELDKTYCKLSFDNNQIKIDTLNALFNTSALKAKGVVNSKGISLNANLDFYAFEGIVLKEIKGSVNYANNVVSTKDLRFKLCEGEVSTNDCKFIFDEKVNILNGKCRLKNVDIKKAFASFDNFSQKVITDKNLEGKLSADAVLNLHFDKDFNFLSQPSSFYLDYSISKGRLRDFELMKKLSLFVEEQALNDVKFENIKSSLQMNNSCINFEPIMIRSSLVDFECFGKHSLDNKIDYQFAINLSELSSKKRRAKYQENEQSEGSDVRMKLFVKVMGLLDKPEFSFNLQSDMKKVKEKVNKDKKDIVNSIDKDFKLNLQEAKKDKQNWEKQEKGEFLIEWEDEKQELKKEKEFENSEFLIEWEE